jgi:hypothetical protein
MDKQLLGDIAARLYAAPLEDFVKSRTAAAKSAASGAGRGFADEIRGLPKPSTAAWAVNMLAVHRPDAIRQLTELGHEMRSAQASLDAAALRVLGQERRRLLAAVMDTVRAVAEQQGRRISATLAAEVEQTLRAATVDEGAAAAVRSGQLLRSLSADGVDVVDLAGAVAVPSALGGVSSAAKAVRPPGHQPLPGQLGGTSAKSGTAPAQPESEPGPPEPESGHRTDQPRLKAVGTKRAAPTPSAVQRAVERVAAAEAAAGSAAAEVAEYEEEYQEASSAMTALENEDRRLRDRLKRVGEELERARKRREAAAANMQLASRAAEKGRRAEVLARERLLRLRNTPD